MSVKTDAAIQQVADAIIRSIEDGLVTGQWSKPWKALSLPTNASSGKAYKGGNTIGLMIAAENAGYSSNLWATYKQWASLGAQVRKGEKGTVGIKWVQATAENEDGDKVTTGRMFPSVFHVFNAEQVDGFEIPSGDDGLSEDERIANADEFFATLPIVVKHGGDRAYYRPSSDTIHLPEFGAFVDPQSYYSTRGHETIHWTGAASRLARDFSGKFGSEAYAFEELVAELASAMLCAYLGISETPRPDHAQYLASWLKVLKNDAKALWSAASAASAAVEYVIDMAAGATQAAA